MDSDISQTNADITAHFNHALASTKDRVRELKLELCKKFDQERSELNHIIEKLTTERDEGEHNDAPPKALGVSNPVMFIFVSSPLRLFNTALGTVKKYEIEAGGNKETMDRVRDQL